MSEVWAIESQEIEMSAAIIESCYTAIRKVDFRLTQRNPNQDVLVFWLPILFSCKDQINSKIEGLSELDKLTELIQANDDLAECLMRLEASRLTVKVKP